MNLANKVMSQVYHQLGDQVIYQVEDHVWWQVVDQVSDHVWVWDQVQSKLTGYEFTR